MCGGFELRLRLDAVVEPETRPFLVDRLHGLSDGDEAIQHFTRGSRSLCRFVLQHASHEHVKQSQLRHDVTNRLIAGLRG